MTWSHRISQHLQDCLPKDEGNWKAKVISCEKAQIKVGETTLSNQGALIPCSRVHLSQTQWQRQQLEQKNNTWQTGMRKWRELRAINRLISWRAENSGKKRQNKFLAVGCKGKITYLQKRNPSHSPRLLLGWDTNGVHYYAGKKKKPEMFNEYFFSEFGQNQEWCARIAWWWCTVSSSLVTDSHKEEKIFATATTWNFLVPVNPLLGTRSGSDADQF